MDLKQRLNTLRDQRGARPASATPASGGNDLAQRLARLQHARHKPRPRREPVDDASLAGQLGAKVIADGVLLIEQHLPLPHAGLADLCRCLPDLPDAAGLNAGDWVFVDTETSGLAGGTGTIAFMLGLARLDAHRLVVRQYLLSRFAGERAMLVDALAWLGEGSGLVSYNGKSFDLPLLKTRSRLAGLQPAAWDRPHLDLLYGVRCAFERRWPDCRLATAEQRLLGVQRHDDLPGSEAPAAWLAHLQQGDVSRLAGVLAHNCQDLVSLAGLLPVLAAAHAEPAAHRADGLRIARRWLRAGQPVRARALLEAGLPGLCAQGRLLLARLRQRGGQLAAAAALLESLAAQGSVAAMEQLAKHHEHVTRDLGLALRYASALPVGEASRQRLARLTSKRGSNGELPL
jgi:uncharacterized protein YprB with RNaseH-like and TPR domain